MNEAKLMQRLAAIEARLAQIEAQIAAVSAAPERKAEPSAPSVPRRTKAKANA